MDDLGDAKAVFHMGGLTNWRCHQWLDRSEMARFAKDPYEWYDCLCNVYNNVRPLIKKPTRRDTHEEHRKKIEVAFIDYRNREEAKKVMQNIIINRGVFDLLDQWDMMIRDDMVSCGLYMKMGTDATEAIY